MKGNSARPRRDNGEEQRLAKRRKLRRQQQSEQRKSTMQRSATVMRKAMNLNKLCGAQVCVVAYIGPNAEVKVWPEDEDLAKAIISKHQAAAIKNRNNPKTREVNIYNFFQGKMKQLEQKIELNDKELDAFSEDSLMDLAAFLESKLQKLDYLVRSIERKSVVDLPYGYDDCNLVHKEPHVQQPLFDPILNCSGNPMMMGFEGQTMFSTATATATATWPWQNSLADGHYQSAGFANCSNCNLMTAGLVDPSVSAEAGTSGPSTLAVDQNFAWMGSDNWENNVNVLGVEDRPGSMPVFDGSDNFGVMNNNLLPQQCMPSQLDDSFPITSWRNLLSFA